MKEKLRIELASENRLSRDTFYAELDLPATAEQIKNAKQRARFTDDGDMIYRHHFRGGTELPCPAAGLATR